MNNPINFLIDSLLCLPGVGRRSAQRMAYHLLLKQREKGLRLADALNQAMQRVKHCAQCNTLTGEDMCEICLDPKRQTEQLCIVEMPSDQLALEQSGAYRGHYFVLMGRLSPLDGVGPEQLAVAKLLEWCHHQSFSEIIFAINPTVEGEATVYYLMEQLRPFNVTFSQLARGVPMGSELELLDATTIDRSFAKRSVVEE